MSEQIRILHVDDDPGFGEVAADFLEREDERISVNSVTSGNEALSFIDRESFDCVISDYDMPGLNGIDFLKAIRSDHPDLPVILFREKEVRKMYRSAEFQPPTCACAYNAISLLLVDVFGILGAMGKLGLVR